MSLLVATDNFTGGTAEQIPSGRFGFKGDFKLNISVADVMGTAGPHKFMVFLNANDLLAQQPLVVFTTDPAAAVSDLVKEMFTPSPAWNPDEHLDNFFIIRPYSNPFFTPWMRLQVTDDSTNNVLTATLEGNAFFITVPGRFLPGTPGMVFEPTGISLPFHIGLEFRGAGSSYPEDLTGLELWLPNWRKYYFKQKAAKVHNATVTVTTWERGNSANPTVTSVEGTIRREATRWFYRRLHI